MAYAISSSPDFCATTSCLYHRDVAWLAYTLNPGAIQSFFKKKKKKVNKSQECHYDDIDSRIWKSQPVHMPLLCA